jgi:hypothetical protein
MIRRPRVSAPPANRTIPTANAVRACYRAHQAHQHQGTPGRDCRTCIRYTAALILATTREETHPPLPLEPGPRTTAGGPIIGACPGTTTGPEQPNTAATTATPEPPTCKP